MRTYAFAVAAILLALLVVAHRATTSNSAPLPASGILAVLPKPSIPLLQASSGDARVNLKAVGQSARLINAAMPYDTTSASEARPFSLSVAGDNHRRALLCLTQAVYYEAGYEPLAGRRAVAQVVLNRMHHPAYPKSVCEVVFQSNRVPVCQFSFVCDGSLNRRPSPMAWRQAREIAAAALQGFVEPSVGWSTHYHADYVAPKWAPMLSKVTMLGSHIFYRWPGYWGSSRAFMGRYGGEPVDAKMVPSRTQARADVVIAPIPEKLASVSSPPVQQTITDVWNAHVYSRSEARKSAGPSPQSVVAATVAQPTVGQPRTAL